MKIAIVGGLGYLGHCIYHQLREEHEVSIIDFDMYGKWSDADIKKVVPKEDFLREDFRKIEPGYWQKHFDKVIICSDVDIEEFYTSRHLADYRGDYNNVLMDICETSCDVYYIHTVTGEYRQHFVENVVDGCTAFLNAYTVKCPILYGTAKAFRSDTIINQAVLHFTVNKEYALAEDPFKIVTFANVWDFAKSVASFVGKGEVRPALESKLPLIMVCNLIQWMFGVEYRLAVAADINKTTKVEQDEIYFNDKDGLTLFINEIQQGMERGFAEELLQEKYDNTLCIQEMVVGMKYGSMFK